MRNKLVRALATVFGIGYLPLMPGTFASAAGVLLYLFIRSNPFLYSGVAVILIIAGFIVSGEAQRLFNSRDPKEVVIDELCGMLIVYIAVPFSVRNLVIGFLAFRLLDILKIYPLDRLERLKGGWGIMLDDIAAGVLTNIILQVFNYVRF